MTKNKRTTGTHNYLENTTTWFPNFHVGSVQARGRARKGIWTLSQLVKQLFLWRFRLGNKRAEQRKKKIKKWKSENKGKSEKGGLCNWSLVSFQIRLLYSNTGGEWFQAADNGPTGSILTFSLVIDELAGWGQGLDLCTSQRALVVTAGGHLQ